MHAARRSTFKTDERLRLGEFGIQARLVRRRRPSTTRPSQGDEGHTMVYSVVRPRLRSRCASPIRAAAARACASDGRTRASSAPRARCSGRSRDADVVLDDPNVSRHHAEVRPSGGSWIVNDLGSTNGIKVNGRRVDGPQSLKRGDVIELGTSRVTFELE